MDPSFEPERILRTLAYALRHDPWQFGLDLDEGGWTPIDQVVEALRFDRYEWALLDWSHVELALQGSDRYEIQARQVRQEIVKSRAARSAVMMVGLNTRERQKFLHFRQPGHFGCSGKVGGAPPLYRPGVPTQSLRFAHVDGLRCEVRARAAHLAG